MMDSDYEIHTKYARSHNVGRNIVYGFINRVFSLAIPFVIRTIVIYRFGAEYLGMNSMFASMLQVLNLADFGFGAAIVYSLYRPLAEDDTETVNAYLGTFKRIYHIIGCVILGFGIFVMPLLPYFIKDSAVPGDLNLYIWYGIFLLDASVSYLLYGYKTAIPAALQRNDILSRIDTLVLFGKTLVQVFVLLLTDNFYIYLLSSLFFTLVRNLLVSWLVNLHYPQYNCEGCITKEQREALKPKVYGILIAKLRFVSRNGIDSICITSFLGLTMTAVYGNYMCIHNAMISLMAVICTSMMASVGNSIAVESREKNYADMRRFNFIYMLFAGWAFTCFLCLYQPFMRLWVGERLLLRYPEIVALSVYYYVLKMGDIRWVYFEGAGLWWQARYIALTETVANLFLNILLVRYFGVLGIIVATLISLFFIDFIFSARLLFQQYYCNGKLVEFFSDHVRYFLVTVLLSIPCIHICDIVSRIITAGVFGTGLETGNIVQNIGAIAGFAVLELLIRLFICTVIIVAGYYLLYHRTTQFKEAKVWVMRRYKAIKDNNEHC